MGQGRRRVRHQLVAALVLACLAAPASGAAAEVVAPVLAAVEPRFDAGRVEAGSKVTHTYQLRNSGPTDLPIVVKASCGCTATDYDRVIPAGGTGKVTAVLDTTRMRGRVEKTIDVMSNDASARRLTLTLIAEPVRALLVKPNDQPTIRGPIGALPPVELTVKAPNDLPFEITTIETDATLTARAKPLDPTQRPRRGHRVTLTPAPDL